MNIVAIIPAKGDSKRVPQKNFLPILGKPLPVWAIEAAKGTSRINKVVITTPNQDLAKMAIEHGAEVCPEPPEISAGGGHIENALSHTIFWLKDTQDYTPDVVVLLQTTNPLRLSSDLDAAIEQFLSSGADSTITVCRALGNHNPGWMLKKDPAQGARMYNGDDIRSISGMRSQQLSEVYFRNDIAYISKPSSTLLQTPPNLYGDKVDLYVMDEIFDTDINTPEDWEITENKLRRLLNGGHPSSTS